MELKKIKEIFSFEKGSLQSSKCTEGRYDFITASSEWKTHNSYDYECEALIVAVAASGSLGRAHYVNGKFISSDLCFILKPKDSDKFPVNLEFYYSIFKSLKEDLVKSTATGTAKKSINKTNFGNYVIPYYEIEEQKRLKPVFEQVADNSEKISYELENQKRLISQLKQAILQEAIQGKLTEDWREQNPNTASASELLKQIKAEKSRLIKDKKIKKEKALTPITAVDIPFELPEGWVWSRIGEITLSIQTGLEKSRQFQDESYSHMYFKMNNIDNYSGLEDYSKITRINPSEDEINDYTLEKGDFLFNTRNSRELVGKTCIFSNVLNNPVLFNNNIARLKFLNISSQFINWWFTSSACRKILFEINSSTTNVAAVYLKQLVQMLVPIAPYEEQLVINSKLNEISLKIQLLEQEIKINEANAQILMQAVLKEAFESKKEEVII